MLHSLKINSCFTSWWKDPCRAGSKITNTWQLFVYQKLMDTLWFLINSKTGWTVSGSFYKNGVKETLLIYITSKYFGMELILDKAIVAVWSVGSDDSLHFRCLSGEEYVNHYMKVIRSVTTRALKKFTSKTGGKTSSMVYQASLQLMEPGQICFLPWFRCQENLWEIFSQHIALGIRGNILEASCKQHLTANEETHLDCTLMVYLYILLGWYPKDLKQEKSLNSTEKCWG